MGNRGYRMDSRGANATFAHDIRTLVPCQSHVGSLLLPIHGAVLMLPSFFVRRLQNPFPLGTAVPGGLGFAKASLQEFVRKGRLDTY
jgi:hypothetical protein